MRYEELQSLCVEIHSGKCDQSRNYEIQRYLNQWSNNGMLRVVPSAQKILEP